MNTLVDDAVGALSRLQDRGTRIDEQINLGYVREWNRVLEEAVEPESQTLADSEQDSAELRREWARSATASQEVYKELERAQEAPTVANVLASQGMEEEIQKLMGRWNAHSRDKEKPSQLWQRLQKPAEFKEAYQEAVTAQEEQTHQETLEEADNLVDVRSLQLMTKQLHLMGSLSQREEYYFPMELGGELTAVHLQICRGEQEKGLVRIELTSECMGSLKGEFQVKDGMVNGYFVGNQREAVMNLRRSTDIFDSYLAQDLHPGQVEYVYNESGKTVMSWDRSKTEEAVTQESLYATAKAFLQTVRDVEKQTEGNPQNNK